MATDITPSDFPSWDPATRAVSDTVPIEASEDHGWALIRYVGHPIGELIPLSSSGLTIGRSGENLLRLDEPEVSRRHAQLDIAASGEQVELRDIGSTNGLYVNGRKVDTSQGPVILQPGDVLRVGNHAFKIKRLDFLEIQYHHAVVAQTTVDSLTGVANRATVLHQLEKHFELARRHDRPLSVILADLDHFKRVNDAFGHSAGDQVLRIVGALFLKRLRGSDHVGRLGGEEFLAVLPETTAALAGSVADDLRRALEGERIESRGEVILATCSLGVAELKPGDTDSGSLLARADAALYRAKAEGRNRCATAP